MRVIAGKARRQPLIAPQGLEVRPTTDRTKETLYNIIQHDVYDCDFLDLFSGSGAIGIEALSRGARHTVFVENSREALACMDQNLKKTMLIGEGEVLGIDVIQALNHLKTRKQTFDIIFMDPPYNKGWANKLIPLIASLGLLNENGMIICESAIDTVIDCIDEVPYSIIKEKRFRTNKFTFIG